MKDHRLLHVHRDFAPNQGGGGVARHIHGLAVTAAKFGFDVRIVAPGAFLPEAEPGYDVRADAFGGLWHHVGWADIVHVHGSRNPIAGVAAAMARLRGKRLVYTPHCYYDDDAALKQAAKRLWDRIVERRLIAGSHAVVLLARFWVDELRSRGLAASSPVILPNCVLDTAILSRAAPPQRLEGDPSLLYVGRLDRVKRLDDAIRALRLEELKQAVLHIVGRGPDRGRLQELATHAGVAARVQFHGFVPDTEVAAMAAGANCFVLPSAAEGGPTVLIEMLLMGCNVIASDIPANRAILSAAGWTQGLYPLGDVEALAATVKDIAGRGMPLNVTERAREAFTWERQTSLILELYGSHPRHGQSGIVPSVAEIPDASPNERGRFLGCPVDLLDGAELLRRAEAAGRGHAPRMRIEGLNVAKLVDARRNADLSQALRDAELVHVDGKGIELGLAALGVKGERYAGIDLMLDLCAQASKLGLSIYLLGARPEVVTAAAQRLRQRWPSLLIAGLRDGYFDAHEEPAIVDALNASGAAFLFIGISSPKKEIFLRDHWERLTVPVAMGVGGTFDVVSGRLPRVPRAVQKIGMEWLFRLCLEPRRLALRYLRTNAIYAYLLARAWFERRIAAAKTRQV